MYLRTFLFLLLFCMLTISRTASAEEQELVFGLPPYANPTVTYESFVPLITWLSSYIGHDIRISVAPNNITHVTRVGQGEVDLAFMGPSPYVKAQRNFATIEPLAKFVYSDEAINRVVIITAEDSKIKDFDDLIGTTFAFGDYHSYGSHFVPRYILVKNGVQLADLAAYDYLGGHDNVALAVIHGDFDAGGMRHDFFLRYQQRGLRVLHGPVIIPPPVIVCRSDMEESIKEKVSHALFSLEESELLAPINPAMRGFGQVSDAEFEAARKIINFIESR